MKNTDIFSSFSGFRFLRSAQLCNGVNTSMGGLRPFPKESIIIAEEEIEKLSDCEEKKKLLEKLKVTKLLMFDDFKTKLSIF